MSFQSLVIVTVTGYTTVFGPVATSRTPSQTDVTSSLSRTSATPSPTSKLTSSDISSTLSSTLSTLVSSTKTPSTTSATPTASAENDDDKSIASNGVVIATLVGVALLILLYFVVIIFLCYMRAKGNCPKCSMYEAKIRDLETGAFVPITKETMLERERRQSKMTEAEKGGGGIGGPEYEDEEDARRRLSLKQREAALANLQGSQTDRRGSMNAFSGFTKGFRDSVQTVGQKMKGKQAAMDGDVEMHRGVGGNNKNPRDRFFTVRSSHYSSHPNAATAAPYEQPQAGPSNAEATYRLPLDPNPDEFYSPPQPATLNSFNDPRDNPNPYAYDSYGRGDAYPDLADHYGNSAYKPGEAEKTLDGGRAKWVRSQAYGRMTPPGTNPHPLASEFEDVDIGQNTNVGQAETPGWSSKLKNAANIWRKEDK